MLGGANVLLPFAAAAVVAPAPPPHAAAAAGPSSSPLARPTPFAEASARPRLRSSDPGVGALLGPLIDGRVRPCPSAQAREGRCSGGREDGREGGGGGRGAGVGGGGKEWERGRCAEGGTRALPPLAPAPFPPPFLPTLPAGHAGGGGRGAAGAGLGGGVGGCPRRRGVPRPARPRSRLGPGAGVDRDLPPRSLPQSNCASTSSRSADTHSPPWRAPDGFTPAEAVAAIAAEVEGPPLSARRLATPGTDAAPSEGFVVGIWEVPLPEGAAGRALGWTTDFFEVSARAVPASAGRAGEAVVVGHRSMAGGARYVWPLTEPLGDGDAQPARTREIRRRLGWALEGCGGGAGDGSLADELAACQD